MAKKKIAPIIEVTKNNPNELMARLDYGRWLWDCPKCRGAELVGLNVGNKAVCYSCYPCNFRDPTSVARAWKAAQDADEVYIISMPEPNVLTAIEDAVQYRHPDNQNWSPGDTVDKLLSENKVNAAKLRPVSRIPSKQLAEDMAKIGSDGIFRSGSAWATKPRTELVKV